MHASNTTVAPTNRARAGNGTARIDTRGDGLREAAARTAPDHDSRPDSGVVSEDAADADYFVHPFVD